MQNQLIEKNMDQAMSYKAYIFLVNNLVAEEKSTGDEQTEQRIEFTKLNSARMRRLDKTITILEEDMAVFKEIGEKQTWLVLLESWCADGAQTIPILNKICSGIDNLDLKIVLRDDNPTLMDLFLTNGTRSIPKLMVLDRDYEVVTSWGPRSTVATKMVVDYKNENGAIDTAFKLSLQKWYNKDKGRSIIKDLKELVAKMKVNS
ncbi:hypothetical protein KCTC52924_00517 [Arenibacter antarcticus]|uniref:Thioredoxin family protein n=1 Tax=Arenibacter antarcticus TaxID=2040469 RepID=A0ABW5VEZ1_9FLAO|nr:thioredoxin family protein [Arenibacter sp. H213]MCM4169482.1 thioredoxin family protein [Arenibacter sp. H213]